MSNIAILAQATKATAVNMACVVQAAVNGTISPQDAARIGLAGMSVAANASASMDAERMVLEMPSNLLPAKATA